MKNKLEYRLIEAESIIKKSGVALIKNIGKVIASITLTVAVMITFTEVSFVGFENESFTSSLIIMLICAYLIYFSLEDAGERLGEESEEYSAAIDAYKKTVKRIDSIGTVGLREFCIDYSRSELEYRRDNLLITYGLCREDYEKYLSGEKFDKEITHIFVRAKKMKAIPLTPKTMLSGERRNARSELSNPQKHKGMIMFLRLIPSAICMTVTVSVMLSTKDGLNAATVIEGILKLSTLPIIEFKGYAQGYSFVSNALIPWVETKTRLLEGYLANASENKKVPE